MRGHGAGQIDPVHEASAEQGAERIGVVRQDDFGHLGLRIADRAGHQRIVCHGVILSRLVLKTFFLQVRLQETFRHLLNASVVVLAQPGRLRQVEFQIAVFHRPMISFADITENEHAGWNRRGVSWFGTRGWVMGSGDGEAHCIPNAFRRGPRTTAGVPKIAECFQNVLRRKFAFVPGSRAVTAPSAPQGKPRRMRPSAIFQSGSRHEVRAGHVRSSYTQEWLELAIVTSWRRSGQFSARR